MMNRMSPDKKVRNNPSAPPTFAYIVPPYLPCPPQGFSRGRFQPYSKSLQEKIQFPHGKPRAQLRIDNFGYQKPSLIGAPGRNINSGFLSGTKIYHYIRIQRRSHRPRIASINSSVVLTPRGNLNLNFPAHF